MKWRLLTLAVLVAAVAAACAADTADDRADRQASGTPDASALPTNITVPGGDDPGSDDADPGTATPLPGSLDGEWLLVGGVDIVDGYPISMTVSGATLGGRSACNQYGGEFDRDGSSLSFGDLFMTEMACEPDVMDAESAYLAALGKVTGWSVEDGQLLLTGPNEALVYERAPEVPTEALVGTTWVLDTLVEDDMAFTQSGDPATLVLLDDGTLTGSTGCRTFTGTWVEADAQIFFTELAADGDCPEDLADQDNRVLSVLGDGFTAEIDGNLLSITSMGNEGLVYRAAP